jgi:nitrogen fixation protein FixH
MTMHHSETHLETNAPTRAFSAAKLWPWVPGLLLAGLIGTQLMVLASVLEDPSFSTESDYYRKAVDWDTRMAEQRRSRALGWAARTSAEMTGSAAAALEVRLVDAKGDVVRGAQVRALAFHNARASEKKALQLAEVSPGVYRAALGRARPGLWEARLSATRGAEAYATTLRFEVQPTGEEP